MSDDTPTQRFPESGGDNPTERISTGEVQEDLHEEKQKSRGLMIGLIAAGALLLIAIIVLVVVLLPKGSGDPIVANSDAPAPSGSAIPTPDATEGATPSATPQPTEEPEAPPAPQQPSTAVKIDTFNVSNKTVLCNTSNPGGGPFNQYISFSWKTSNADSITIGTYDPYGDYSGYYYNLPPDGNTNDLGLQITYGCPEPSQKWRLEVTGNGQTVQQEINIVNNGDTQ